MHIKIRLLLWIARLFIGSVISVNLLCAFDFLFNPQQFLINFSFTTAEQQPVIQGIGLLFIMWNIPYLVAFINPLIYNISLYEAVFMQFIGLAGELILLGSSPNIPDSIKNTVIRFSIFDGVGFVFLIIAIWLVIKNKTKDLS
jgi:hypothetical protein